MFSYEFSMSLVLQDSIFWSIVFWERIGVTIETVIHNTQYCIETYV